MATVEPCETQPSGLPSTLNLYDTFKPSPDEEKDSDEESFHLPMLDCDDDIENNSKEALSSETGKEIHNGETEDDILNKFESNCTPDIDPKMEDSILDEIDNLLDKKLKEDSTDKNIHSEDKGENDCLQTIEEFENKSSDNCVPETSETDLVSCEEESKDNQQPESNETLPENEGNDKNFSENEKIVLNTEDIFNSSCIKKEDSCENDKIQLSDDKFFNVEESANNEKLSLADEIFPSDKSIVVNETGKNNENNKNEEDVNLINENDSDIKDDEKISNNTITTIDTMDNVTDNNISQFDSEFMVVDEIDSANDSITDEKISDETDETVETAAETKIDTDNKNDSQPNETTLELTVKETTDITNQETDDLMESNTDSIKLDETDNDLKDTVTKTDGDNDNTNSLKLDEADFGLKDTEVKTDGDNGNEIVSCVELMEVDNVEIDGNAVLKEDNIEESMDDLKDNNLSDDPSKCSTEKKEEEIENSNKAENNSDTVTENQVIECIDGKNTSAENTNPQDTLEPDKCENSNDSSKSQNLECDDLLDISVIRDADEDNASAIAENANDGHTSEKSDNDNDDQDEGSEKAENELDESEMDQDDTLLVTDKDDNMDFEDGSSSLCDQDNVISEHTSDSEKDNVEVRDSENDSRDINDALKQKTDFNNVELDSKENHTEEENFNMKDISSDTVVEGNQDSSKEILSKVSGKRSLSETNKIESPNKKIKLSEPEEKIVTPKKVKVKTLLSFEKYMQNKKLENKLTRSDLEQFCLQKICEAIMHKTDVGELHQTIKKQEQIIENLRKDLQQLSKQTRDLDIVNKKLMNELRSQNGTKKPLVPLKITRSVGLQVKLNSTNDTNTRRKGPVPSTPRTPVNSNNNTPTRARNITPANATVVRQISASPRKSAPAAPLLSQALQSRPLTTNNTVTKRPPIRPKPAEPQKGTNSSVIDLTDEDDKASKGVVGNSVKIMNKLPLSQGKTINLIPAKTVASKIINSNQSKTVAVGQVKTTTVGGKVGTSPRTVTSLPQGVRLTPTQVKNGSITIPASVVTSSSGTTQFMYVVQPGSMVTSTAGGAQKAVLLNFQPTNGVLNSGLNGSAVSVLPTKTTNTVQLKTVSTLRKHPAPLPCSPPVTLNASLKPLLPKPHLSIRKTDTGIILQWRMPYNLDMYEAIASYQLFAYQETNAPPSTEMWRKVGDVKALALPMACTLTQFADKNKYYFAVRSIDVHKRIGAFSDPEEISL